MILMYQRLHNAAIGVAFIGTVLVVVEILGEMDALEFTSQGNGCLGVHQSGKFGYPGLCAGYYRIYSGILDSRKNGQARQNRLASYTPSAITSSTSGTILFSKFSIPDFKVNVEDGQPLQAP